MIWTFFAVVLLGLLGAVAALVTSRWRFDPLSDPVDTVPDPGLPDVVHAGAVDAVRFDTALRGYRIDQVDEVLDRLRDRIAEQEATIRALRAELPAAPARAAEPEPEPESESESEPEPERGPEAPTGRTPEPGPDRD